MKKARKTLFHETSQCFNTLNQQSTITHRRVTSIFSQTRLWRENKEDEAGEDREHSSSMILLWLNFKANQELSQIVFRRFSTFTNIMHYFIKEFPRIRNIYQKRTSCSGFHIYTNTPNQSISKSHWMWQRVPNAFFGKNKSFVD